MTAVAAKTGRKAIYVDRRLGDHAPLTIGCDFEPGRYAQYAATRDAACKIPVVSAHVDNALPDDPFKPTPLRDAA